MTTMPQDDPPLRRKRQLVDEDSELRIRPDERTPPPGHQQAPVRVPDRAWTEHGRRKGTSEGHATGDAPVE